MVDQLLTDCSTKGRVLLFLGKKSIKIGLVATFLSPLIGNREPVCSYILKGGSGFVKEGASKASILESGGSTHFGFSLSLVLCIKKRLKEKKCKSFKNNQTF